MPLVLNSSSITGLAAVGGLSARQTGEVLQVVSNTYQVTSQIDTTSTTFITTGLSGTITPTSASSKILAISTFDIKVQAGSTNLVTFYKNGSNIVAQHLIQHSAAGDYIPATMQYLDSPASTSALTYTVYFRSASGSYTASFGGNSYTAFPIGVVTLMEIAA